MEVLCSRIEYLEAIESGVASKSRLADELGVTESAVYKAVRKLRENDLVDEQSYSLSVTGKLLLEGYRRMERVSSASELLDDLDVPTGVLEGARPELPRRHAPQKPIEKLEREAARSETMKGLAPTVLERYVTSVGEMVENGELEVELLMETSALEVLDESYPERFWASVEQGMETLVTEEELPYGLAVFDDSAVLVAYDDRGRVQGALFMRSPDALDWAERLYLSYRKNAEHLEGIEI